MKKEEGLVYGLALVLLLVVAGIIFFYLRTQQKREIFRNGNESAQLLRQVNQPEGVLADKSAEEIKGMLEKARVVEVTIGESGLSEKTVVGKVLDDLVLINKTKKTVKVVFSDGGVVEVVAKDALVKTLKEKGTLEYRVEGMGAGGEGLVKVE